MNPTRVWSALVARARAAVEVYRESFGVPRGGLARRAWLPLALGAGLGLSSCNYNAYTVEDDVQLGLQAYTEVTASQPILQSGPQVDQVQRVTDRLVASVMEMKPEIAPLFQWEVVVIDEPGTVNAFCLPGGKMAVYTGILPVAQSDAGLAVVMGHEIAHATERHGTERLSRNGLLGGAIEVLLEDENQQAVASVLANLGIGMPWGRTDELEADREGLMILANAGYDPREAPRFWERMAAGSSGGNASGNAILAAGSIDEFLSTHPSNQRRIDELKAAIPAAMPLYEAAIGGKP